MRLSVTNHSSKTGPICMDAYKRRGFFMKNKIQKARKMQTAPRIPMYQWSPAYDPECGSPVYDLSSPAYEPEYGSPTYSLSSPAYEPSSPVCEPSSPAFEPYEPICESSPAFEPYDPYSPIYESSCGSCQRAREIEFSKLWE